MSTSHEISVRVLDEGKRAELRIPASFDTAQLTPALVSTIAAEARVQITAEVARRITSLVDAFKAAPQELVADIARATEPIHGTSGTWTWESKFDPAIAQTVSSKGQGTDHHAPRVLSVTSGMPIARLTAPTGATDGRTVTGGVLPARPGSAAALRPGEGLEVRSDGVVVAKIDGAIVVAKGVAFVSAVLKITGCVDFSTGHIDFKGDIDVASGVRDGFNVRASGNISIRGAVEGADLVCGGNLTCSGGIASARRAHVVVNGNSDIGFLRNVSAVFLGDLACRGELEHSDIVVGGECHCESGRIIGGRLVLTGTAHIGTIGSPNWAPTVVCVGDLPLVAMELQRLSADAVRIQKVIATNDEAVHLLSLSSSLSASARERLTELQYELSELRSTAAATEAERERLREAMRLGGQSELHVARAVYPKVKIQHGTTAFEFEKEVKGPLKFVLDSNGVIQVCVSSQNPRPITDFAHATQASPAPAATAVRKCA